MKVQHRILLRASTSFALLSISRQFIDFKNPNSSLTTNSTTTIIMASNHQRIWSKPRCNHNTKLIRNADRSNNVLPDSMRWKKPRHQSSSSLNFSPLPLRRFACVVSLPSTLTTRECELLDWLNHDWILCVYERDEDWSYSDSCLFDETRGASLWIFASFFLWIALLKIGMEEWGSGWALMRKKMDENPPKSEFLNCSVNL